MQLNTISLTHNPFYMDEGPMIRLFCIWANTTVMLTLKYKQTPPAMNCVKKWKGIIFFSCEFFYQNVVLFDFIFIALT